MSIRLALLFFHVIAALGFAAALGLEWLVSIQIRTARLVSEAALLVRVSGRLTSIGAPSLILLLATGITLAALGSRWGEAWLILSLVAMGLTMTAGAGLTGPATMALRKTIDAEAARAQGGTPVPETLRRAFQNGRLRFALRVKTTLVVGLVFLMTVHPDATVSILCVALAVGVAAAWFFAGPAPRAEAGKPKISS